MTISAAEPVSVPPGSPFAKSSVLGVLTPLRSAVVIATGSSAGASAARIGTARPRRHVRISTAHHALVEAQRPGSRNNWLGIFMRLFLVSRGHAPYGFC